MPQIAWLERAITNTYSCFSLIFTDKVKDAVQQVRLADSLRSTHGEDTDRSIDLR